jgi:hypothetical protein
MIRISKESFFAVAPDEATDYGRARVSISARLGSKMTKPRERHRTG